jgi:hypothetical protein
MAFIVGYFTFNKCKQIPCHLPLRFMNVRVALFTAFVALFFIASCKSKQQVMNPPKPVVTQQPQVSNPPNDLKVILHEEMINKSLAALGNITGKEPYKVLFVEDTFTYTLINPKIYLHPGKAEFVTDVNVTAGPFSYSTPCKGDVLISYDRTKNLIYVKILKAVVGIYTKILGTKYHIKDIDIASNFEEPFTFEGPAATSSEMEMEMPDGTKKTLVMTTTSCDIIVMEDQLMVPCEVEFVDKEKLVPKKK